MNAGLLRSAGVVCCSIFVASASAQQYQVEVLIDLPDDNSWGYGINENGVVSGKYAGSGSSPAFVWDGALELLANPQSGNPCWAFDINDNGDMAGWCLFSGAGAVRWVGGVATQLAPSTSLANAINNSGVVAGYFDGANGSRAATWANQTQVDLPFQAHWQSSFANHLNDTGRVVGHALIDNGGDAEVVAVLWDNGQVVELPSIDESGPNWALAVNSQGVIVGTTLVEFGESAAWIEVVPGQWVLSVLSSTDDDCSSVAHAVNDAGVVVGQSTCVQVGEPDVFAYVYEQGQMKDLNDHVSLPDNMVLVEAHDINESGQIVGYLEETIVLPPPFFEKVVFRAYIATRVCDFDAGDVNEDGVIDPLDLRRLNRILNLANPTVEQFCGADVDYDGQITQADLCALKTLLGLPCDLTMQPCHVVPGACIDG